MKSEIIAHLETILQFGNLSEILEEVQNNLSVSLINHSTF
jgi:hypothetical protein